MQVDLSVDIGGKIANRLATPGGHLDKDMSHYDESQKMVLKELVPFYAGFVVCQIYSVNPGFTLLICTLLHATTNIMLNTFANRVLFNQIFV